MGGFLDDIASQWFLLPQGTGIIAVVLHQLDYQFHGLKTISVVFWILTMTLLLAFAGLYLARLLLAPRRTIYAIIHNTSEAACLASLSVSFSSVIQMLALVVVPSWGGRSWGMVCYVLWWIDLGMALTACFVIPVIFVESVHAGGGLLKAFTPATQLPLISVLTSAASAGTLSQYAMLTTAQKIPMIVVSYLEVGVGVPLAILLGTLFMVRVFMSWDEIIDDGPLAQAQMYTAMVLCGPWGQSSFALQALGMASVRLAPDQGHYPAQQSAILLSTDALSTVGYGSMFLGLVFWGQGTFWWVFAISSITRSIHRHIKQGRTVPFGLPTWAMVFPWGVYTNAAVQLGVILDSKIFKVWSTILAVALVMIWLTCLAFTLHAIWTGNLLSLRSQRMWNKRIRS